MFDIIQNVSGLCQTSYLFVLGYATLLMLFFCICCLTSDFNAQLNSQLWGFRVNKITTKLALVCLILAFAGIPPFYFFFCKLAVLSVILVSANWTLVISSVSLIMLAWYSYLNATSGLLNSNSVYAPQKPATMVCGAGHLITLILLTSGWYFFDDLIIVSYWLSI